MMKKKATKKPSERDDDETMMTMPRVVLKGSGRKSKEGQTTTRRIVEKIVEEHDIAYVESYEDERLLRTVLKAGEEEGESAATAASTS